MTEDDLRRGELPLPLVFLRRHVFDGGYALLLVSRAPQFVIAQASSTRYFPPSPWAICPIDGTIRTALELAEEKFYADHPDHHCTSECDAELREMGGGITSEGSTGTVQ